MSSELQTEDQLRARISELEKELESVFYFIEFLARLTNGRTKGRSGEEVTA